MYWGGVPGNVLSYADTSGLFPCTSFDSGTHTTAPKISLIRLDLYNPQITISVSMSST